MLRSEISPTTTTTGVEEKSTEIICFTFKLNSKNINIKLQDI